MSPNATLLAYTGPSDIKELRDQAALISILWREAEQQTKPKTINTNNTVSLSSDVLRSGELETLTVESETSNIIVRAIQPRLLLILVGGKPPKHEDSKFFKITPETVGDARYPPADHVPSPPSPDTPSSSSPSSAPNDNQDDISGSPRRSAAAPLPRDLQLGLLHIQRNKVDAATEHMRADFKTKGFSMPHDLSIP